MCFPPDRSVRGVFVLEKIVTYYLKMKQIRTWTGIIAVILIFGPPGILAYYIGANYWEVMLYTLAIVLVTYMCSLWMTISIDEDKKNHPEDYQGRNW